MLYFYRGVMIERVGRFEISVSFIGSNFGDVRVYEHAVEEDITPIVFPEVEGSETVPASIENIAYAWAWASRQN